MKSNDTASPIEKQEEQMNIQSEQDHMSSVEEVMSADDSSAPPALTLAELGWDEAWEYTWREWLTELNETAYMATQAIQNRNSKKHR